MANTTWRDMSRARRAAVLVLAPVELILTAAAVADLSRRPQSRIRGPKALWWMGIFVQPVGAPAYLAWGRRTG